MTVTDEKVTPVSRARRLSLTVARYRSGAAVARRIPQPMGMALARVFSLGAHHLLAERRFMAERHLQRVNGPEFTGKPLAQAVQASFATYARYWFDSARIGDLSDEAVGDGFSIEGFSHLQNAMATGTAPILALPHLGGWEWAGMWMARIPRWPVLAVVEPQEPVELFDWMVSERQRMGMDIVSLGSGVVTTLVKALKAQQVVCLLADRQVGDGGVEVEFFGERTVMPGGPAALALRTGAAILPVAVYHDGPRHRAVVLPPVPAERQGKLRADITRVTQDVARALEDLIRPAPEQWHMMQPNWPSDHDALAQFREARANRFRFAKRWSGRKSGEER